MTFLAVWVLDLDRTGSDLLAACLDDSLLGGGEGACAGFFLVVAEGDGEAVLTGAGGGVAFFSFLVYGAGGVGFLRGGDLPLLGGGDS